MKKSMLALLLGSALVLAACGGDEGESSGSSTQSDGEKLTMKSCATCHGGNLEGRGNTPDLNKVGARLTEEEILDIIVNGTDKGMPPNILKGEDAKKAAAWLAEQK